MFIVYPADKSPSSQLGRLRRLPRWRHERVVDLASEVVGRHAGDVAAQVPGVDERGVELVEARAADEPHAHLQLVAQELHGAVDAVEAVRGHGVEEGAADADAPGAEAQGLEDVGGAADAAVDVDLDLALEAHGAQHRHRLGEDLDAGARELELAAAVVREHDALDAALGGLDDVLDALHALEHDGHLGDGAEPGDVGPGERGVDEGGDGARGALRGVRLLPVLHARPLVDELGAHVLLAAAELGRVDGDEEALAAARLGVPHDALRYGPVRIHVQLQPLHLVAAPRVDDLVERARRQGRYHLHHVVLVRCARQDHLALRIAQLAEGRGRHVEGHGDLRAEHGRAEIDALHVHEDLGPEPYPVEGLVVLPHCLD